MYSGDEIRMYLSNILQYNKGMIDDFEIKYNPR